MNNIHEHKTLHESLPTLPKNPDIGIGSRIREVGGVAKEYILARVGVNLVVWVNLGTGNQYTSPLRVENTSSLTRVELSHTLCGSSLDSWLLLATFNGMARAPA